MLGRKKALVGVKHRKAWVSWRGESVFLRKVGFGVAFLYYSVALWVLKSVCRVLWAFRLLVTSVIFVGVPLRTIKSIIKSSAPVSRVCCSSPASGTQRVSSGKNLHWNVLGYSVFLMPW